MELQLRRVRPEDAAAIAEIYNFYVLESTATFDLVPVTEDEMRSRIAEISSRFPYWVCCRGDDSWEKRHLAACGNDSWEKRRPAACTVVGYCCAHPWRAQTAYAETLETTVYVAPDRRGQGVGRLLAERLIDDCRARGFHALVACITADNAASIRLHEKLGFRQVSKFREVGMKFGRRLDVTDLELLLD